MANQLRGKYFYVKTSIFRLIITRQFGIFFPLVLDDD